MGLSKARLGELIELVNETNNLGKYRADDVRGMTITKEIIPTKANVKDTDLSKFIVVKPGQFVFNPRTHGKKIGFGFNSTQETFLISWNNVAFRVKREAETRVLPTYLFMHFNRAEWDREACYQSWGSSTEVFSWDALCDMELLLPDLHTQEKYVSVYNGIRSNLMAYQAGLEELKMACDAYVDKLIANEELVSLAPLTTERDERNGGRLGLDAVRGISVEKKFIPTKAKMAGVNLDGYKLVNPDWIAFVTVTSRNSDKITIAMNDSETSYLVSSTYVVFETDRLKLLPEYLMLFFSRKEFDRYARFNSWGSARETFDWQDMLDVKIPVPSIGIQRAIADVYLAYVERKRICDNLSNQLKGICPILIKGSIDEARRCVS